MKTTFKNTTIKTITFLMIGVMGLFITNKLVFSHLHKLDDGTVIEHAHPYNRSTDSGPYKSHHHTKSELLFFQNLRIIFPIIFIVFAVIPIVKKRKFYLFIVARQALSYIILCKGRAPPIS